MRLRTIGKLMLLTRDELGWRLTSEPGVRSSIVVVGPLASERDAGPHERGEQGLI